jgi:EipB-like
MRARPSVGLNVGFLVFGLAVIPGATAAPGDGVVLAPHRAVYDMSLGQARTGSSITAVKGRMVYELTGSACEGYTQNMRFVTEMSSQEGQPIVSDLRSSTWEDGTAGLFRFNSTQLRDQKPSDATLGDAKRAGVNGAVTVDMTKPTKSLLTLKPGTMFPVQHSIALLVAAKAGQSTMRADLYDGSDKGEKAYDTNARIGRQAAPGANRKLPELKNSEPLDTLPSWPVTISYFEPGQEKQDATPVYELGFLYFENGVSRKLVIDYGDFAIKGELTGLTFLDAAKCDPK